MLPEWSAAALAVVALAGCFPQFGEYGGAGGQSSDGGAAVGDGGTGGIPLPQTCDGDGFCIEVPTGWEGPVALSEPGGACGGAYARQVAAGETDLAGDPATCGCQCGAATGSTCPAATVTRYFSDGCVNVIDTINVPSPGCPAIGLQNAGSWTATAVAAGGSCPPTDQQETPPVAFDERVLCAADAPPSCDGGAGCAPRPEAGFEPRICIMEDGDVDCTSPSFGVKTLLFTGGHDDTRGCDVACDCQAPTAICGGVVSGRQLTSCGASQDGVVIGMCDDDYVQSNQSLEYFPMLTTQGACSPVPRASVGEVVGLGPITLCCSGAL